MNLYHCNLGPVYFARPLECSLRFVNHWMNNLMYDEQWWLYVSDTWVVTFNAGWCVVKRNGCDWNSSMCLFLHWKWGFPDGGTLIEEVWTFPDGIIANRESLNLPWRWRGWQEILFLTVKGKTIAKTSPDDCDRQGMVADGFPSGKVHFPWQLFPDGLSSTVTVT
jgi:hypothetical protein